MQKLIRVAIASALSAGALSAQAPTPSTAESRVADSLFAAHAYRLALTAYDRLTRADSLVPRYWFQLGMSAAQTQDYSTGARAFGRATALGGGPAAAYNAAAMHARLTHADSAFFWLRRAIQMGFSDTTTFATDDDLASLRGDARYAQLHYAITHPPVPCTKDADFRRFDFWVGNWTVTNVAGAQTGTSRVEIVSAGCALLENWRDLRGGEGKSLNTYDQSTNQWRQFWVGQGGLTDFSRSEWRGTTLSFLAEVPATNAAPRTLHRLSFTPLAPDVVRQHAEVSTDGGRTWTIQYDFRYHRAP